MTSFVNGEGRNMCDAGFLSPGRNDRQVQDLGGPARSSTAQSRYLLNFFSSNRYPLKLLKSLNIDFSLSFVEAVDR